MTATLKSAGHENDLETALTRGDAANERGDYRTAGKEFRKALEISLSIHGEEHAQTAICYQNLSLVFHLSGEFDSAIFYLKKSLEILVKTLGPKDREVANSYNLLGIIYDSKGDYDQALSYHKKALNIRIKAFGPEHSYVATSFNNLAIVHNSKGEFDKAISYYEKALGIWSNALDQNFSQVATSYNNFGNAYNSKGEYDKSISFLEKALDIRIKAFGPQHPDVATSYNNLGAAYYFKDEYDKAISYYERALEIIINTLGSDHPEGANSYNNIGSAYNAKEECDQAIPYFEKALEINLKTLGSAHRSVALSYNNLGAAYHSKKEYGMALAKYKKALKVMIKAIGRNHSEVASIYNNLGNVYQLKGEYHHAIFYHLRALAIKIRTVGPEHPGVALSCNNLGFIHHLIRRSDKAIAFYENSLAINRKNASRQQTVDTACNIGRVYLQYRDYSQAKRYFEEGIAVIEKNRREMGAEKSEFTGRNTDIYRCAFFNSLWMDDTAEVFKTAELMKEKGFLEHLSFQAALNSKGIDPRDRERALQLSQCMESIHQRLQAEINKAKLEQDKTCLRRLSDELETAEQEFASLEEKLLQNERYRNLRHPEVISLETARALCDEETAILDYVILEWTELDWQTYCLVITQNGLDSIELPADFKYEATIDNLRQALLEANDESAIDQYSAQLYNSLIKPLMGSLHGIRRLIVIPDGALAKLPFDLLRAENTEPFLGEDYLISLSPSVSVLAMTGSRNVDPARDWFLGFGGIDYDPEDWGQDEDIPEEEEASTTPSAVIGGKNSYYQTFQQKWPRLPGTYKEVQAIRDLFSNPEAARIVVGAEASEAKLKEMSDSLELAHYRIVHFAGHGYYDAQNPSFSALVLAEVSGRFESAEDGYLSVPEAALLHFNADMVNLSTCASGLGKLEPGDGLIGLTRAFLVAGANRAGVTLWPVQDSVAMQFMVAMYEKVYKDGRSYPEAYAETKREFIRGERSEALRSPRYWSPFVLYGI
ncbi:MAG TPA: CHAT domain-containing tetratricopeptide repeat protein [Bacillota bacterium]|nr:CHAT domain-containing tetratricopeptide repeat protein [Bacillota bacterium]